ncbi:MAG: hypothetical protein NC209_03605, partial [Alistipes sp.]|nr:hypothetical protein [Alistipes senegalensis]MCM1250216.1 hypothetical protein [Alistipes sp.]
LSRGKGIFFQKKVNLPLFVPAKSGGKPTLEAWAEAACGLCHARRRKTSEAQLNLSARLSPPATERLTLLRAPIRGCAAQRACAAYTVAARQSKTLHSPADVFVKQTGPCADAFSRSSADGFDNGAEDVKDRIIIHY